MIPKYEKLFDEEIKEFIRISETFAQEHVGDFSRRATAKLQ